MAAFGTDWLLANLASGFVLVPLLYIARDTAFVIGTAAPAVVSLAMVFLTLLWRGNTPGKRWFKLHLMGSGCLICREIRRLGWLLLLGLGNMAGMGWPAAPILMQVGAAVWLLLAFVLPLVRQSPDFPHDRSTGFFVA